MTDQHLAGIAHDLGVSYTETDPLIGSMSGSHVHAVTRQDHSRAVLKITTGIGRPAREAAERELHLYLHASDDLGVRTPKLLDYRESVDTIAILLTAHPAPRPAVKWTHQQWLDLADDLAHLHQTPMPEAPQWRRPSWLTNMLHHPDLTAATLFWSRPGEPELFAPILADTPALHEAISLTADCFLHGDCHTDNILIDHHHLVWIDWQGAGYGNPAVELAFPSIRATPHGAALPQQEMIHHYASARGLDGTKLNQAVLAAELAIFLFSWPEYAAYNTVNGIEQVHQRVQSLARAWLSG